MVGQDTRGDPSGIRSPHTHVNMSYISQLTILSTGMPIENKRAHVDEEEEVAVREYQLVQDECVAHVMLGFMVDTDRMKREMGDQINWGHNEVIPTVVCKDANNKFICSHQITASGKVIARGEKLEEVYRSFDTMIPIYRQYRDYVYKVTLNCKIDDPNVLIAHFRNAGATIYKKNGFDGIMTYNDQRIQHQFSGKTSIVAHGESLEQVRANLNMMMPLYQPFASFPKNVTPIVSVKEFEEFLF